MSRKTEAQKVSAIEQAIKTLERGDSLLISDFIADFVDKRNYPIVADAHTVLPIVWFGDLNAYFQSRRRIVTVGLNPSLREFSERRFNDEIDFAIPGAKSQLVATLTEYFERNPYNRWFCNFEKVLQPLGASYYSRASERTVRQDRAVHIDLFSSLATNPTWGSLSPKQQHQLSRIDLFHRLLQALSPDIIVYSARESVREDCFKEFRKISEWRPRGKTRAYIRLFSNGSQFLLAGLNYHGQPFGTMKTSWIKGVIDSIDLSHNASNGETNKMKLTTAPVPPTAKFGAQKLLIIKVWKITAKDRGSIYEAVRRNWAISTARAENRPVVAVTLDDNVIQEIYDVKEWHVKVVRQTKAGKPKDFYEFTGNPMSGDPWADALIGKRIPDRYIGGQNCVRYVN